LACIIDTIGAPSSAQLGQAVVDWVNTFNEELTSLSDGHCSNMVELCDGVVLFELCAQLAPTYFEFEDVDRNTGTYVHLLLHCCGQQCDGLLINMTNNRCR
jgi:hypothetical protein